MSAQTKTGAGEPMAQHTPGLSTPEGNEELAWEARWARKCERLQRELAETKAQRDELLAALKRIERTDLSTVGSDWLRSFCQAAIARADTKL